MRTLYILLIALFVTQSIYADDYNVDGPDAGWDNDDDSPISGDVNGDKVVNIVDIVALIKILNESEDQRTADEKTAADINKDNVVDLKDLDALKELVLKATKTTDN